MGQSLHAHSAAARAVFAEVDAALGEPLSRTLFGGPAGALARTACTQPALLAHSVAALRALQGAAAEAGAPPPSARAYLGHSVGEYAALVAGGALGLGDAARLLRLRGEAMQRAGDAAGSPTAMAALLLAPPVRDLRALSQALAAACQRASAPHSLVALAALNSPSQAVLSGHASAVARAVALLQGGDSPLPTPTRLRRVVPLPVSAPFHTPLMAPAALALRSALGALAQPLQPLHAPLVCGWSALPVSAVADIVEALVQGVTSPVQWGAAVEVARAQAPPLTDCIEFGAGGGTLCTLVKQCSEGDSGAQPARHIVGTWEDVLSLTRALK